MSREIDKKRSLSDVLDTDKDIEPKSKNQRASPLEVSSEIRFTYRPNKEESLALNQGIKPSQIEGFKEWLQSLTRTRTFKVPPPVTSPLRTRSGG
mmetsp:Transcript_6196/g.13733  ORF Transcript_6196/g.13733 Transcript_6196/m.13733 type:complete len:95 (-) Transcript_6196:344-628(-)